MNTMNLDGETNLKEKTVHKSTENIKSDYDLRLFEADFQVEKPNPSLVKITCNIKTDDEYEPMDMKQLLLRACVLKNTD